MRRFTLPTLCRAPTADPHGSVLGFATHQDVKNFDPAHPAGTSVLHTLRLGCPLDYVMLLLAEKDTLPRWNSSPTDPAHPAALQPGPAESHQVKLQYTVLRATSGGGMPVGSDASSMWAHTMCPSRAEGSVQCQGWERLWYKTVQATHLPISPHTHHNHYITS